MPVMSQTACTDIAAAGSAMPRGQGTGSERYSWHMSHSGSRALAQLYWQAPLTASLNLVRHLWKHACKAGMPHSIVMNNVWS